MENDIENEMIYDLKTDTYSSSFGYAMKRDPERNDVWVLYDVNTGEEIDRDRYRNDIADRHLLNLTD